MATLFKQVADNAISYTNTSLSATGVTSVTLNAGDGTKFPTVVNGYYLTIWNGLDPSTDPNMEKVLVSGRTGDVITHSATTKTHTAPTNAGLLNVSANMTDLQTAVNAAENNILTNSNNIATNTTNIAQRLQLAGDITGGTAASPQVTNTHLSAALPVAQGGSGTQTAFTQGSILFAGPSGVYAQRNANLFWDNTNFRLGVGTATPTSAMHVYGNQPTLLIESSGDHPQLQFKGTSGGVSAYSLIQGSYNGQYLDIFINSNSASSYRLTDTAFQTFAQSSTAIIPLVNSLQMILQGSFWNGTGNGTATATLQYVMLDSSGNARLAIGANGEKVSLLTNGNVGIGTTTPGEKLEIATSAATMRIHNTNDTVGGFVGNNFNSLQLGIYNPGGTTQGVLVAGEKRTILAMDFNGKVGSVSTDFGSPTYRNVLDDGSGNASFAGTGSFGGNMTGGGSLTLSGSLLALLYDHGGQLYNVKHPSYGAKGDTVQITDGAVAASGTTVTSPSGGFANAVVGQKISVVGAGIANSGGFSPLQAAITVINSTTSVTVSVAAVSAVSGAVTTYGTSDTTAIQNALNAAGSAGGGIVYCPPGGYRGGITGYGCDALNVPAGVMLLCAGVGATTLYFSPQFSTATQGASSPLVSKAYIRDCTVSGATAHLQGGGVAYRNTQDCWFQNVYIRDVPNWSVLGAFEPNVPQAQSIYFEDCVFDRGIYHNNPTGQDMTAFNNNDYVKMTNVEFRNNNNGFASCLFYGPQNKVDIDGMRFVNCFGSNTNLNVNGITVNIRNLESDGGVHLINGKTLNVDGVYENVSDNNSNGVQYYMASAAGFISNMQAATRMNSGSTTNYGGLHIYDSYQTIGVPNNYLNAAAAGATTLTFTTVPPGYVNGCQLLLDMDYSNKEIVTLLSGAGTTTWTLSTPLQYAHTAGYELSAIYPAEINVFNTRVSNFELNLLNLTTKAKIRAKNMVVSSAADVFGYIGFGNNSAQTLATTITLEFDSVEVNGGVSLGFYQPSTNLITYKGYFKNVNVFGNNANGWVPTGVITLAQNIQMRFEDCHMVTGWGYASGPAPVIGTGAFFKNNRKLDGTLLSAPTGVGTTPAMPASGTAITNASFTDVDVYINGGAVTQIALNAVNTGIDFTPCIVRLPAGQTIKLTYTSAPTWTWIGA